MKNFSIILLTLVCGYITTGCGKQVIKPEEYVRPTFEQSIVKVQTPEQIAHYLRTTIFYKADTTFDEEYKSPERTYNDMHGDCEDYALIALYIARKRGYTADLLALGNTTLHMVCWIKGHGCTDNGEWVKVTTDNFNVVVKTVMPNNNYAKIIDWRF